jgi:catechol 2,3-dioxygenase-like lactoylglutathione lyase family enzyme
LIATGVHHVSFSVSDLGRARAFYEGVLGLQRIERPDLGRIEGVWYRAGNSEVHLIVPPAGAAVDAKPARISPVANHVAFRIEDYGRVRDLLKSKGVEVLESGAAAGQMWIRDPDGNVIELIAPRETALGPG